MPIHKLKRKLGIRGPEQQQKEHDNALDRKGTAKKKLENESTKESEASNRKKREAKMVKWKFIVSYWHGFYANWIHGEWKIRPKGNDMMQSLFTST